MAKDNIHLTKIPADKSVKDLTAGELFDLVVSAIAQGQIEGHRIVNTGNADLIRKQLEDKAVLHG